MLQQGAEGGGLSTDQFGQGRVDGGELTIPCRREDAQHQVGDRGGGAVRQDLLVEGVAGDDGAGEGPPGGLGCYPGDGVEVERRWAVSGRGGPLEAALVGEDRRGGLGEIVVAGPGDGSVGGEGDVAGAAGGLQELQGAGGVEAVAQRGPGRPVARSRSSVWAWSRHAGKRESWAAPIWLVYRMRPTPAFTAASIAARWPVTHSSPVRSRETSSS